MGVNSLPKTVTRQRRDRDLNPGPSAPETSTLTTRLPSHPAVGRRAKWGMRNLGPSSDYRHSGGLSLVYRSCPCLLDVSMTSLWTYHPVLSYRLSSKWHKRRRSRSCTKSSDTTHFVPIDHRHCSTLGRVVLNMYIPTGLFTLEFGSWFANFSLVQFVWCERGYTVTVFTQTSTALTLCLHHLLIIRQLHNIFILCGDNIQTARHSYDMPFLLNSLTSHSCCVSFFFLCFLISCLWSCNLCQ